MRRDDAWCKFIVGLKPKLIAPVKKLPQEDATDTFNVVLLSLI